MEKFVMFEKSTREIVGEFKTEREVITAAFNLNISASATDWSGWPERYGAEYRTLALRLGVK